MATDEEIIDTKTGTCILDKSVVSLLKHCMRLAREDERIRIVMEYPCPAVCRDKHVKDAEYNGAWDLVMALKRKLHDADMKPEDWEANDFRRGQKSVIDWLERELVQKKVFR